MKHHVFISGGGIAGLTLALKLAEQKLSVVVVEKDVKPSIKYKGELLQPRSLEVLAHLGLLEEVLANGYPIHTTTIREEMQKGHREITFRYGILHPPYNYALMISHETLKNIIIEKARQYPDFHYVKPAKFLSFKEDEATVVKRTAIIQTEGGEEEWEADFFVGAEGRISSIRNGLGIPLKETAYNHHFLTVSFPRPSSLQDALMIVKGHCFLGMFPLPDNRVRTVFLIKPDEYKQMRKGGLDAFYDAYCRMFPDMDGYVQSIESWKQIQLMIPVRHNAKHYVRGNGIIIGDAAHSVHPMAGEGMNLAIQDAEALGELFAWMFQTGHTDSGQLKWFEKVRKPRAEYLSQLSHQSALAYSYSFPFWNELRSRVLKRMEQSDALHFKQMLNISGMGIWKETLLDRFIQAGLLPSSLLSQEIREEKYLFTEKDKFPWR